MIETEKAREILKDIFPYTEKTTQYLAVYKSKKGREFALERDRSEAFYIWVEKYDGNIDGICIKNAKNPRQPYSSKQPRNSNLNETNSPRLKVGNKVWYLEISALEALKQVSRWYNEL